MQIGVNEKLIRVLLMVLIKRRLDVCVEVLPSSWVDSLLKIISGI